MDVAFFWYLPKLPKHGGHGRMPQGDHVAAVTSNVCGSCRAEQKHY